jgi:hypothetical protein
MASIFAQNRAGGTRGQVGRGMDSLYLAGQQFNDLAAGQGQRFNRYQPQAEQALGNYAGLLQRRATDSDRAGYVNRATAPVQRNFLASQAGLTQNLAQRGISPNSSLNAGAQAVLEGQRASALSQAQNDATNYFDEEEEDDLAKLLGLYGGAANQSLSAQSGLLGQGLAANESALGYSMQQLQQEEEKRRRQDEMLMGLLGTGFSSLGGLFGRKGK